LEVKESFEEIEKDQEQGDGEVGRKRGREGGRERGRERGIDR
jgi:hypothetical protein